MSRSTEKKAVFFDADGTLCDMEKGVPDSTKEALKKLRENGHEAFVSWYLEELPFTGMISACGATIEKDGKRLFNKEMTPEVAKMSVEILRKYGLVPVMEGADFMYYDKDEYNTDINWYCDLITESLGSKWRPIRGNEDCMKINKISAKMVKGLANIMTLSVMRAIPESQERRLNWFRKDLTKQWELPQSVNSLISHGKIRSYSETAIMIWRCLNTQL